MKTRYLLEPRWTPRNAGGVLTTKENQGQSGKMQATYLLASQGVESNANDVARPDLLSAQSLACVLNKKQPTRLEFCGFPR